MNREHLAGGETDMLQHSDAVIGLQGLVQVEKADVPYLESTLHSWLNGCRVRMHVCLLVRSEDV